MSDLTFEEALNRLEEIARQLEEGLPLEESLKAFEEGVRLFKYCAGKLERAEQKVQMLLTDSDGEVRFEPLAAPDQDEDEN